MRVNPDSSGARLWHWTANKQSEAEQKEQRTIVWPTLFTQIIHFLLTHNFDWLTFKACSVQSHCGHEHLLSCNYFSNTWFWQHFFLIKKKKTFNYAFSVTEAPTKPFQTTWVSVEKYLFTTYTRPLSIIHRSINKKNWIKSKLFTRHVARCASWTC